MLRTKTMNTQLKIISQVQDSADVPQVPWLEQELPFADKTQQEQCESCQEVTEFIQETHDLRHEKPDVGNPVTLSPANESLPAETDIDSSIGPAVDGEPRQVEPDIGTPVSEPLEERSVQKEPVDEESLLDEPEDVSHDDFFIEDDSDLEESDNENSGNISLEKGKGIRLLDTDIPYNVPSNLQYHGYDYIQVCRGSRSLVYHQTLDGKTISYEVSLIRIQPETTLGGKVYPPHERFPKDEDFGYTAWTYPTLEQALAKFHELEIKAPDEA